MTKRQYRNVLILMSDEHSNKVLGCHGHPHVRSPNLDRRLPARAVDPLAVDG